MHPASFGALALFAAAALVGCTLLVGIDDKHAPPIPDGGPFDAGPPSPCEALSDNTGIACGASLLAYPGSPDDLVTCINDAITATKKCATGCIQMPPPYPDACDTCRKTDGKYCGHELTGFPPDDAELVVVCAGGNATNVMTCHQCKGNDAGGATCAIK